MRSKAALLGAIVTVVVACSGGGTSPSSPPPSMVVTETPAPSIPSVPPSPAAGAAVTPIPGCLPACVEGGLVQPGDLPAGDYTTVHFFGGQLTVSVPKGWSSYEDSTGEFALTPRAHEGAAVLFWLDVYPAIDPTNEPVPGIDRSIKDTFGWLEANPNLVISARGQATLGGLAAQTLEFERSAEATNVDPGCPAAGRPCVGLFGFPQWEFNYSQGGPFHLRLTAADAAWGGERHVIYAMTQGGDAELYAEIESQAEAMIASARLPLGVDGP